MKISIITLFPQMFSGPFDHSILKNAKKSGRVKVELIDLRKFGLGKHKIVDDAPYGGGVGMIMRVDVVKAAIDSARIKKSVKKEKVILLSAAGEKYTQPLAKKYSKLDHLIIVCGHYEGIDERISNFVDEELSIGDYILTGGEIAAMLVVDSVVRLIPGVLKPQATLSESFNPENKSLLEYPQFTRPPKFEKISVPKVLLSGDHGKIDEWRKDKAIKKTSKNRPDLLSENR